MATKTVLLIYSSAVTESLVAAFEVLHKNTLAGNTVVLYDAKGVTNANIAIYIAAIVAATYDEIWVTAPCDSTADTTAVGTLNLADQYALRASLKVASQGTLGSAQDAATTHTATTIGLSTASPAYVVNAYIGDHVFIYAGTGIGQIAEIKSNTATVLTIRGTFYAVPDGTSGYKIITGMKLYLCGLAHTDSLVVKGVTEIAHAHLYPNNPAPIICGLLGGTACYSVYSSTACASIGATSITDSATPFTAHALIGKYVQIYSATTNGWQYGLITENTTSVITLAGGWNLKLTPTGTPAYKVVDSLNFVFRDLYIRYYVLTYLTDLTSGPVLAEYKKMFDNSDNGNLPSDGQPFVQDWDWINGTVFSKGSIMFDALRRSVSA
jgi:hypothetical protein